MSTKDLIKCLCCGATGKLKGLGSIQANCKACKGVGYTNLDVLVVPENAASLVLDVPIKPKASPKKKIVSKTPVMQVARGLNHG